ncbi:ImmA/IrrE family metallo-endopeptidase [Alkalibacillus sp. S2W]|uniref:ImmA/IrrE family metallo-endopeptidase n=1 Tax=Alkalibacillus sp. S2W TaxID=3386553 RepID=UPI00398D42C2
MMDKLVNRAKVRAHTMRNQLGLGDEPIHDIFQLLEQEGVFVFQKTLSQHPSAMFMRSQNEHIVIINSAKSLGHQHFSVAHEYSHYLFDQELAGGVCLVNFYQQNYEKEQLADLFATYFLMPEEGLLKHLAKQNPSYEQHIRLQDVLALQQHFKVSWAAMLWRLLNLNLINRDTFNQLKERTITYEAQKYGFPLDLYHSTPDQPSQRYIEKIMTLYDHAEISEQKADEYLNTIGKSFDELTDSSTFDHSLLIKEARDVYGE